MWAEARVVAECGPDGVTRLPVLRGQSPLCLRRTGPPGRSRAGPSGGAATVHLIGGAAGPLGGDDLRLSVEVGPGASLCLRSVAATVALPGPRGAVSSMCVSATVAAGGSLVWLPEPLVAARDCRHRSISQVELAEGARLTWRDELVCGRYGEAGGDVVVGLTVAYAGVALYQQELAVGPHAPGWDGPAVLDGARATGTLLQICPEWADGGPPEPVVLGPTAASMPLAGPGVVTTAVGPDAAAVRRFLTP